MIVVDANLLIFAYDTHSRYHEKSRSWLDKTFSGSEPVGLPWQTIAAFLRITTNPRLPKARPISEAVREVQGWLEQPNVRILSPGDDHWRTLRQMMFEGQAFGPLVSDAQIAALTIENGAVLYSSDRDFARFPGLRWVDPLG